MNSGTTDTGQLIRRLSRRQWTVSLTVVGLALISLLLGWQGIASDEQAAESINLAGRQRMLSQRMAMYLALQQGDTDQERQRQYQALAARASDEFERAHERLTATARKLGPGSAIHSQYFGPAGGLDAESRRYMFLVREALNAAASAHTIDPRSHRAIVEAAGTSLINGLHEVTEQFQHSAEQKLLLVLRLLQISTFLIVALIAFGMIRIFRPVLRELASNLGDRDQAQRDLKESEERFKAFSECSSDWFWQTDQEHRFRWLQDGKNVQTPLPFEKVMGKTRLELRPEMEKTAVAKWLNYEAGIAAHRPFRDFEYQTRSSNEDPRWISVSGQPFFDGDGRFMGYRGTAKYIQAQKDIEASHLRLQLAIEQSPVSITIADAQARFIYVNAHFSVISGYSAAEAIGRTPRLLAPDRTRSAVFADMRETLLKGRVWRGEVCSRKKSGELFWENQSISPVHDQQGITTHYVAVSEDITAARTDARREQSRSQILEAIANGSSLQEALKLMIAMAEAELPGSICTIQRLDRALGTLHSAYSSTLSDTYTNALEGQAMGAKVGSDGTAQCAATGVLVADIETHPDWREYRAAAAAEGLRTCWSHPILSSGGDVQGTLDIYHRRPCAPGTNEIQVIELVSSLAAICLERDDAERQLRQQQQQTRKLLAEHETILANALVGIVYLKHRRVISCNRRLEELFGYDIGELIGESSERFYTSHETFETIGAEAYRVVAENHSYSTELMLRRKDGSHFRGALNGCAIDPTHPQEGSIWVYADISERYRAEQQAHKLLQAVEQSPTSIVITNRDGLIEYVNPRFTKVTGYGAEEVIGQNPRILQSGETPLATYQELWQTILAGREWHGIVHNRRKNGELFWEEASISPILNDKGETTHFVAVKEDITERKRIEDELQQHRMHLEELVTKRTADLTTALEAAKVADQAKDAFLANVSHELRTPLNAVIGLSELARRISTDPKQQDYLDKVSGAGRNLAAIINDLLDLSKISANRMEFEVITFSVRGLVQRSRSVMAHRAAEKGLELVERIDAGVPDVLIGDPLRIEQILLNLLSNAIKFTACGRIELRIGVYAHEANRVCLNIEVEDTGIGLTDESIARLFQPFAQADASMNRRFGGTGLGLALCKRLAQRMGGDISVSSHEGAGTTFRVRLCLEPGAAADLPAAAHAPRDIALPARYLDTRVLLVEDQPLNREIVEALLAEVGILPSIATNGQEARDLLREAGPHAFDMVLMDIQMPIMDGLTATREIRAWSGFGELPIIAMTAHTMAHETEISTAAGMNDHIGKPFETANFFRLLARWIPAAKHQPSTEPTLAAPKPPAARGLSALHNIDAAAGLARFVGNETRYLHWLKEFVTEAPGYAPQIRRALAAGQPDAARQAAHAIKGRVGMLGMSGLHPIAATLEAALQQGAATNELLDQLQATIDVLCAEIAAALDPGTAPPTPTARQTPTGPRPPGIAQLLTLLEAGDGGSADALQICLAQTQDSDWAQRLKAALGMVQRFDFSAASKELAVKAEQPPGNNPS